MKDNKKQLIRKKEVEKLFNSFKKEESLEDWAECSEEELKMGNPKLNKKEIKLLFLKIQQWKYAQKKGKKDLAIKKDCLTP